VDNHIAQPVRDLAVKRLPADRLLSLAGDFERPSGAPAIRNRIQKRYPFEIRSNANVTPFIAGATEPEAFVLLTKCGLLILPKRQSFWNRCEPMIYLPQIAVRFDRRVSLTTQATGQVIVADRSREASVIDLLRAAHKGGRKLTGADVKNTVVDLAAAYRIQDAVAGALGPVGAFKTGRTSADETPIMAPIPADRVRRGPALFSRSELDLVGIELEVAFRVDRALPDPSDVDFAERARGCVSPLTVIEVVDTRLADCESADPLWKLADNQINAGVVHGEPVGDWRGMDLSRVAARLEVAGETVFDGISAVPGGDAFDIFCAFARLVGDHCGGLQPGHLVTTGSVTGLRFIEFGQSVHGQIEGLGAVRVNFPQA
jgi:2-keto-4-pentenoate hydratase